MRHTGPFRAPSATHTPEIRCSRIQAVATRTLALTALALFTACSSSGIEDGLGLKSKGTDGGTDSGGSSGGNTGSGNNGGGSNGGGDNGGGDNGGGDNGGGDNGGGDNGSGGGDGNTENGWGGPSTGGGHNGGQPAGNIESGDIVAAFRLEAPVIENFILRGTLPLPRQVYVDFEGEVPFKVLDSTTNTVFDTQVEVVTRYPSPDDGADVVQIIAQVVRPEGVTPGEMISYEVVFAPHAQESPSIPSDVQSFFGAPASLLLRTEDCFGHVYDTDLLAPIRADDSTVTVLRNGEVARQRRTHTILLPRDPQSGSSGTLPHMMGVHAYITEWADEEFFSVDLRIHNGMAGLDQADPTDDAMKKLYFDHLELQVPSGWTVISAYDNPELGAAYAQGGYSITPLVAAHTGTTLHYMPKRAQIQRRLVIAKAGTEARAASLLREEGLAFCAPGDGPSGDPYWSWFNPQTGRYFPQAHWLPTMDHMDPDELRVSQSSRFERYRDQVSSGDAGTWPVESAGLGWAHPWLVAYGGTHGGVDINIWEGVQAAASASRDGFRFYQLQHRMYGDRHPTALYNTGGEPTQFHEWVVQGQNGPYQPVPYYDNILDFINDPFGFDVAPNFQVQAVQAQGRQPAYEQPLSNWMPIDRHHLVRYTKAPMVLMWLGNDALAKDSLRMEAELFRFVYCDIPNDGWDWNIVTGLLAAQERVAEHPGMGFTIGRGEGWGLNVVNATYAFMDDDWRARMRPWLDKIVQLIDDGQADCTGLIQSEVFPHLFDGQYRCRQSIEAAILENALYGMREHVYRGADATRRSQLENILTQSLYGMISAPSWSTEDAGPLAMMAIAPANDIDQPFCTWFPADGIYDWADHFQIWNSFAYGYDLTGDTLFLSRAVEALGGGDLGTRLRQTGTDNLQNRAALLALAEFLE